MPPSICCFLHPPAPHAHPQYPPAMPAYAMSLSASHFLVQTMVTLSMVACGPCPEPFQKHTPLSLLNRPPSSTRRSRRSSSACCNIATYQQQLHMHRGKRKTSYTNGQANPALNTTRLIILPSTTRHRSYQCVYWLILCRMCMEETV